MRAATFFIIKWGLVVAAAAWIAMRPGRMEVEWLGWRVETNIGLALLALAITALCGAMLLAIGPSLRRARERFRERRTARTRVRALRALKQGMAAVAAGDAAGANKAIKRLDATMVDKGFVHLIGAQAAQLAGDDDAARAGFTALTHDQETEFLGMRGLIAMAVRDGDMASAFGHAAAAYRLRPRSPWLVDILADLYGRTGRWQDAQAVLETAAKHKLFPPAILDPRLAVVLNARAGAAEADGDRTGAMAFAKRAHKLDPRLIPATSRFARLTLSAGVPGGRAS